MLLNILGGFVVSSTLVQYWDTAVIIDALQQTDASKMLVIEPLIKDAEDGKLLILISTYVLIETYKDLDGVNVTSKEEDEKIVAFFENPFFEIRDVTEPIALSARKISREHGIKAKDSVHVATAIYHNVSTFFTYDIGLLKKNGKIGNPPLQIIQPEWKGQEALFIADEEGQIQPTVKAVIEASESKQAHLDKVLVNAGEIENDSTENKSES
jgi:predicted nucleic acid-binding protein